MKLLDKLRRKHKRKVKKKERNDVFHEFGQEIEQVWENEFTKLQEVVKSYERKTIRLKRALSREEQKIFHDVENIVRKIEHHKKSAVNVKPPVTQEEMEQAIIDLRRMAKKLK